MRHAEYSYGNCRVTGQTLHLEDPQTGEKITGYGLSIIDPDEPAQHDVMFDKETRDKLIAAWTEGIEITSQMPAGVTPIR